MAKQKRTSETQLEYSKQRKRIQNLIKKYESQGLFVNYVPPKVPKKITPASVRKLERVTFQAIRKHTFFLDIQTGELTSFNDAKKLNKAKPTKPRNPKESLSYKETSLPKESTIIISNFRAEMSNYNYIAKAIIFEWLNNLLSLKGENAVAKMLKAGYENGAIPDYNVMYDDTLLQGSLAGLLDFMDVGQFERDELEEALEEMERW